MFKVPKKILGYFQSFEGIKICYRVRSYLSTTRKQNMSVSKALMHYFKESVLPFMVVGTGNDTVALHQTSCIIKLS